ncbi:hypothetical protein [Oceanobacillus rekensis]|uniref:hypothetical protein n=1 Tax=Oceanobacillus rekensis TaxID=937927 RepID=UPI000B44CCB3|nr:hypothetical protein [Oceanobacillus rekensis]
MHQLALIFLAAILAGFALIAVATNTVGTFLSPTMIRVSIFVGAIVIILFALAMLCPFCIYTI